MAKRAAGYIRVSTVKQIEGTSLDTQRERIEGHAKGQGWDLVRCTSMTAYRG